MSERLKEPVLKTGDVRASVGSNPTFSFFYILICTLHMNIIVFEMAAIMLVCIFFMEKYSRGRRGAPAKGVGRETGARVQIPPSPPPLSKSFFE